MLLDGTVTLRRRARVTFALDVMTLLYLKAAHVVGFVAWFAGLFYWLRIFVYLAEAAEREEPARAILLDQFTRMERRVYAIITRPAAVWTWACGLAMIAVETSYLAQGWLQIKLGLLVALTAFQAYAKTYVTRLETAPGTARPERLRLMNEVPTLFLLAIVLLAVLRSGLDAGVALATLAVFAVGLALGVRYYRGYRARHPEH